MNKTFAAIAAGAALALASSAQAADWSDTSLGYRYGNKFAEPFNSKDISKNILNLTHASGFKYGSNFLNVDMLMSDSKDPSAAGSSNGAHEVYVVYRNTLDFEKLGAGPIKFGPVRGMGLTTGFDFNTKTDVGYNSKKRMFVVGPTLMFDVPGFFNASLLLLKESNQPSGVSGTSTFSIPRYSYKTHAMLGLVWGIPLNSAFSFEGFGNFIASKGKDEFGGNTAAETLVHAAVMYDLSGAVSGSKGTFKVGAAFEYWKNKFGNNHNGFAGTGAFAKTPMLKAEYHF